MNENHAAFDQRFEAGQSVIEAIDLSAARRPYLEPKPDQEDLRSHSQQKATSEGP
ncbi:hypothetical protein [Synechococcus sp. CBW1004]|uniref:hypothetical protein n=1 Tax=Synechococcus sp. CBW1004 TaxID=1353136 RepID=UPI0018CF4D53|nr:hypothetical protein [Synechococcus sp. CBW1004]QPN64056.1 hypothetical protein H8F25_04340 [Synechococcus sp. CBW1004]